MRRKPKPKKPSLKPIVLNITVEQFEEKAKEINKTATEVFNLLGLEIPEYAKEKR